jgi:glycosyltransferase involved in cell wall biosynthesis
MKIAYIVPSLANKGPVIVVQELVRQFVKHGHECTVFFFDDIVELIFDCTVQRIGMDESVDFSAFDVVHSHGMRPDRYVTRFARKNQRTSYLSTMHSYLFVDLGYQYNSLVSLLAGNWWLRRWTRRHDRIITLSKDAMKYYRRWFHPDRLTYAYNTRNLDPASASVSDEEKETISSFKGSSTLIGINALLTAVKGVDQVIRVLAGLPDHKLFVAGDGKSLGELENLARREGVADRCLFVGYRKDAFRFLPYYDIYAMPSRSEGFPLALLEASVFSKPTVCSSLPVIRELFDEGEVAFFDLEDTTSLQKAILHASGNMEMGAAIHRRYEENYSPECFYRRHFKIYNDK